MVRRTKQEALETRDGILDAAEHVFHERGVSRTSLQEIAQAAGVTRGAIYWHFKDKSDVFNAMMLRVTLPMEEAAKRTDDPLLTDPVAHLRDCFVDVLTKTANDPQVKRVFEIAMHKVEYVAEVQAVRDRHLQARDECHEHIERGLGVAMKRGQLSKRLPPKAAALGMHALIDGLLQNWMLDPSAFDLVKVGSQVIDTYLAGLRMPKAA
jgi:TetR/AcrR family acrAB operon transcriptional repressor